MNRWLTHSHQARSLLPCVPSLCVMQTCCRQHRQSSSPSCLEHWNPSLMVEFMERTVSSSMVFTVACPAVLSHWNHWNSSLTVELLKRSLPGNVMFVVNFSSGENEEPYTLCYETLRTWSRNILAGEESNPQLQSDKSTTILIKPWFLPKAQVPCRTVLHSGANTKINWRKFLNQFLFSDKFFFPTLGVC